VIDTAGIRGKTRLRTCVKAIILNICYKPLPISAVLSPRLFSEPLTDFSKSIYN